MITHDPHLARVIGNKIWILEQGCISHEIKGEGKKTVEPKHLIGQIDYALLESREVLFIRLGIVYGAKAISSP